MRYVALLRGIGPGNPNMRNERLRDVAEGLGFHNVQTIVSSGNIVFDTKPTDVTKLEARMEAAWPEELGFNSITIVRSRDQVEALIAQNPFGDRADTPTSKLQVTFLKDEASLDLDAPYGSETDGYRIVAIEGGAICSVTDLTVSNTPELMRWLERRFGKALTTRTWKTVHRIQRKFS